MISKISYKVNELNNNTGSIIPPIPIYFRHIDKGHENIAIPLLSNNTRRDYEDWEVWGMLDDGTILHEDDMRIVRFEYKYLYDIKISQYEKKKFITELSRSLKELDNLYIRETISYEKTIDKSKRNFNERNLLLNK